MGRANASHFEPDARRSARKNEEQIMGVIAESIVAYAQPLLDETDGSHKQVQNAMSIAQLCWNLALLPESQQEEMLVEMRPALKMDEAEFADFRESVIAPMILRQHELFPNLPRPRMDSQATAPSPPKREEVCRHRAQRPMPVQQWTEVQEVLRKMIKHWAEQSSPPYRSQPRDARLQTNGER